MIFGPSHSFIWRIISAMEAAQDGIQRETAVGGGRKKGEEASGRRQT